MHGRSFSLRQQPRWRWDRLYFPWTECVWDESENTDKNNHFQNSVGQYFTRQVCELDSCRYIFPRRVSSLKLVQSNVLKSFWKRLRECVRLVYRKPENSSSFTASVSVSDPVLDRWEGRTLARPFQPPSLPPCCVSAFQTEERGGVKAEQSRLQQPPVSKRLSATSC